MPKGLATHRGGRSSRVLGLRWLWSSLWRGARRRRKLHQQVHRLRREVSKLRHDNRALAERNGSVEKLSAELMRFNLDLTQVSRRDPMTGLLNRAAFEACLVQEHALADAARQTGRPRPYSVIMLDVDHFKHFNDTLGHPAGDRCLIDVSHAIQDTVRHTDYVGRYGGEEIIVLCPGMDTADATGLAERLRHAVRDLAIEHPANSAGPVVTVSVGLATGGTAGEYTESGSAVVVAADRVLYEAKHDGRDRVVAA